MRQGVRFIGLLCVLALSACGGGGTSGGNGTSGAGSGAVATSPAPADSTAPPTGTRLDGPRPVAEPREFVTFESGQVRPLALDPAAGKLFAVNTPDGRVEVLDTNGSLTLTDSITVGLEPVALALAPDGRLWVVNHLSDSVSIVDLAQAPPAVVQTLWVGDEPRDIVFAGPQRKLAFISTVHRGQHSPVDPALTTPGVGRADVWVFDSTDPGAGAGQALTILTLFGDTPRALAASEDGSTVYAAVFKSGNRTSVISPELATVKEGPFDNVDGIRAPDSGLIVVERGGSWVDPVSNRSWDLAVPYTLPDLDVFEIDAMASPPAPTVSHAGVGTILFNMVTNPVTGTLYVSNLDARNRVRFAGAPVGASSTIRGHVADNQVTVIGAGGVTPRKLNKHLDFASDTISAENKARTLSQPMGMAVSGDGTRLFVTAFGSSKLAVYDTAALESDSFQPDLDQQVPLSGGGPSGVVLDEAGRRAFVMTRFDNGISVVDTDTLSETQHLQLFNPEPPVVVRGRRFLYDANVSSLRGNDACASCHIFGDNDALAWDLGEPAGSVQTLSNTFINISAAARPFSFHPMKGPMTTQSMRGLRGHGPMHWRGDRSGSARAEGETLEEAAFKEFNEAFDSFFAGDALGEQDLQDFTDFALQITYPPNPLRGLDNGLDAEQSEGLRLYNEGVVRVQTGLREVCAQCHPIDPAAGVFGTRGLMSDNAQQGERNFKIPHFRDQYQKVGMFGFGFNSGTATGPQIRGFGFNHNGATSGNFVVEDLGRPRQEIAALRAFLFAFPTESPPITGQQATVSPSSPPSVLAQLDLLIARAVVTSPVPECDLVASMVLSGQTRRWLLNETHSFTPDAAGDPPISREALLALASELRPLTFLCVPWGSGVRVALDRDLNGVMNGDEVP